MGRKKFNWLGLVIDIVKVVIGFVAGSSVDLL